MASLKKKITYENLLYLILLMAPFLDATSFLFRQIFNEAIISPATVIRPIIPICLLIYIFIKEKKYRLPMIGVGIIYALYGIGHMLIFNQLFRGIAFGNFAHEFQYIYNYTFMIGLLLAFYYVYKNYKMDNFLKLLLQFMFLYILIYNQLYKYIFNTYIKV